MVRILLSILFYPYRCHQAWAAKAMTRSFEAGFLSQASVIGFWYLGLPSVLLAPRIPAINHWLLTQPYIDLTEVDLTAVWFIPMAVWGALFVLRSYEMWLMMGEIRRGQPDIAKRILKEMNAHLGRTEKSST